MGWKAELAAAAGYRDEYKPGRYCGLISVFQDDVVAITDSLSIVQAFEEVRARPLEELPIFDGRLCKSRSLGELYGVDLRDNKQSDTVATEPARALPRLEAIKQSTKAERLAPKLEQLYTDDDFRSDLRKIQKKIGIPDTVNGFAVFFWACHRRAKRLMEKISRGQEDKDGILFAALLNELDVCFR